MYAGFLESVVSQNQIVQRKLRRGKGFAQVFPIGIVARGDTDGSLPDGLSFAFIDISEYF